MRIVIVRDRESSGGGIHNYYRAVGHHMTVAHELVDVGRPHSFYAADRAQAARCLPTPVRLCLDWAGLLLRLCRFPDLVHLNPCLDPNNEFRSLRRDAVNLVLARLFGRKVLVFWRGWDNAACGTSEFPCGNRGWMSRVYRWADAHIVLASAFRDDLRRWGFNGPIYLETTVVADSILEGCVELESVPDSGVFRLLFLSRVEVAKGVLELLDAFVLLNQRRPGGYHLTIAGDGPDLKLLKRRASDLGLPDIDFTGFVEGMQRAACYAEADAFCFLSYTEGMPNAVLEAMAMGLPLVSSAAGGLRDILEHGVSGYLIHYDRCAETGHRFPAEEVADRIEELAIDFEARFQMADYNRTYARERFAAARVAARLESIYHEMLGQESPGGIKVKAGGNLEEPIK